MVKQEELVKVANAYKNSNGVCIFVNHEVCNTDDVAIYTKDDKLCFEFLDDDIKDFKITADEVEKIVYEEFIGVTIITIKLNNGNHVKIHNL